MESILFKNESYEIIGICLEVYNELGYGFKEIVYKDALAFEFEEKKIPFVKEMSLPVYYKGNFLGMFNTDFLVHDQIILEIKATECIHPNFFQQVKNYLKASGLKVGIIVNFGESSLKFKRVVL